VALLTSRNIRKNCETTTRKKRKQKLNVKKATIALIGGEFRRACVVIRSNRQLIADVKPQLFYWISRKGRNIQAGKRRQERE
jgi:hypothetical protein